MGHSTWDPIYKTSFCLGCADHVWIFQKSRGQHSNLREILLTKILNIAIAFKRAKPKFCISFYNCLNDPI